MKPFFFLIRLASTLVERIITTNYKKLPPLGDRNRIPIEVINSRRTEQLLDLDILLVVVTMNVL